MENELFAILDEDAQNRNTHRACLRAVARANKQFSAFFKQAGSDDDYMARFELVRDRVSDIVREACIEEGTTALDTVAKVLAGELARLSEVERGTPQDVDVAPSEGEDDQLHVRGVAGRKLLGLDDQEGESKTAAAPFIDLGDSDADAEGDAGTCQHGYTACPECFPGEHGGNKAMEQMRAPKHEVGEPQDEYRRRMMGKVAVDTGDTYTQETETLPKADADGLADEATVSIDMASAGDENHTSQKPIDIPSTRHNPEVQDVSDTADYTATLETPSGVAKRVDADSPMQPEHNVAPGSETWHGTKDQANPVTSKWKVLT